MAPAEIHEVSQKVLDKPMESTTSDLAARIF